MCGLVSLSPIISCAERDRRRTHLADLWEVNAGLWVLKAPAQHLAHTGSPLFTGASCEESAGRGLRTNPGLLVVWQGRDAAEGLGPQTPGDLQVPVPWRVCREDGMMPRLLCWIPEDLGAALHHPRSTVHTRGLQRGSGLGQGHWTARTGGRSANPQAASSFPVSQGPLV